MGHRQCPNFYSDWRAFGLRAEAHHGPNADAELLGDLDGPSLPSLPNLPDPKCLAPGRTSLLGRRPGRRNFCLDWRALAEAHHGAHTDAELLGDLDDAGIAGFQSGTDCLLGPVVNTRPTELLTLSAGTREA